jgi:activator of HSP90 ATPase
MKDFRKYYVIPAEPEEVYNALVNPIAIRLWTGEDAVMSEEPGSEFSLWEGSIEGRNLSFEPNRKIEQEWYFGEQETRSIVVIKLHAHEQGTSVEVRHSNIPDEAFDDISEGWTSSYMASLDEFFS